ncbi:MAG TPA: LCP family protein [Acidimicrobiia bacterium]|nr:LCP family protein [Acidimicrobiia bacterium]
MSQPTPPPLPPRERAPAAPPPPRTWVKKALVTFLVVANLVVFGVLGAVWLAARKVSGAVGTIPASELTLVDRPVSLSEPRVFLLIGSDSRENLEDLTNFGPAGGQRADVIMLVKVDPRGDQIQMLSLPRDLKISYNGRTTKINATFNDGPSAIVQAVRDFTGSPVHHYLQVEFSGFAGIVDAIGGIEMTFPNPARDLNSGFEVDAGRQVLDGRRALAYARSRHYQEFRNGSWVSVQGNDINRTRRQQDVLMAILTQVDRPTSIGGFNQLLDALGGFVVTDEGFDEEEILQLAWEMRSVGSEDLDALTLPVRISNENGTSYVVPVEPDAGAAITAFLAGQRMSPDVGLTAAIQIQNGNGRTGAAGEVGSGLTAAGFNVVGTADSARADYGITQVIARPNLLHIAEQIVEHLGYGEAVVGGTPEGVDIVVIVGLDAPPS